MKDRFDIIRMKNLLIYKSPELLRHTSYFLLIEAICCVMALIGIWEAGSIFAPMGKLLMLITFVLIVIAPVLFEKGKNIHNSVFDFILPVSNEEHFLYYWLKYVVFIPVACIGFLLLAKLGIGLLNWAGAAELAANIAIREKLIENLYYIIGFQSLFLCSIFVFRKKFFIKTLFVIFLYMLFTLVLNGLLFSSLFFGNQIPVVNEIFSSRPQLGYDIPGWLEALILTGKYIQWLIFPLGLWLVSYLYIKEKEV